MTPSCGPADAGEAAAGERVRWLDAGEQAAWRSFLDAHQLLMTKLDSELREASPLGLTEYTVLVRLSEAEDRTLRMATLAADTGLSRSRLTHIVSRLEERGIVCRDKSVDDRRGVQCRLTEEGFGLLERTAPVHVAGVREHLIDLLGREQIAQMAGIFDTVLAHMRALPSRTTRS
ncbi:MarR family winged helix-turn-helix transcriptional regulator [Brevibacterium album]|uniref:MarR family winged helix-turn-helix transcriptional regulator n=1 Tax=Brevibacterium album TaxID=417948 RepID=UPI000414C4DD|nr:MarR family transcriptional regulator [Brevibacterium album]